MPMYPDTSAAIDRIRAMQKYSNQPPSMPGRFQPEDPIPYRAPEPRIDIGELDTGAPLGPMDMPTEEQINTPVYGTGNETFGMGPQQTFTAPEAPSKRDRIAAALQKRRQMQQMQTRPYGG